MLEIIRVETPAHRREFVSFPVRLYKGNDYFVPEMRGDALDYINPKKNVSWQYWPAQCFLARRDGKTVGRVMAILQTKSNDVHNECNVRFGLIDFIDDLTVSRALLETVEEWGRQHGMARIHGPLGFMDSDSEGMLVEGFDELDMLITIYNAPYYARHMEALGYKKDIDWVEYQVMVPDAKRSAKLQKLSQAIENRFGYTVQHFSSSKEIMPVAAEFLLIVAEAYKDLYGYVQMNEAQAAELVDKFFPMLNPSFVKMVRDRDGQLVGGGVAIPSLSRALQKCSGRLFPWGWLPVLRALKKNDRLELLLVAVRPEFQNRGVPALLLNAVAKEAADQSYVLAETGPELETNEKVQAMWKPFERRQHRRRRVYIKDLA